MTRTADERFGSAGTRITSAALLLLPLDGVCAQLIVGVQAAAPWVAGASIFALLLAVLAWRWRRLLSEPKSGLASIRAVSKGEFLRRLAHAFRSHGYTVERPGKAARRGGVGLVPHFINAHTYLLGGQSLGLACVVALSNPGE